MKRGRGILIGALAMSLPLPAARAAGLFNALATPAVVIVQAQPVFTQPDVVSIVNRASELSPDIASRAISAVGVMGGAWAMTRGASVGMHAVRRGAGYVQQAPDGFNFPMATTAVPLNAVGALMGRDVAAVLARGFVIMGRTTAGLRGAMAGDAIDIVAANGSVVSFAIGLIANDAVIGGTEIMMTTGQADLIGVTLDTRIVMWGFQSRNGLDQQLARFGLQPGPDIRIRRSWGPFDPDSTIGMALTKAALGEFAYQVNPNGVDVTVTGNWENAYIPPVREVLTAAIPIRARCNVVIRGDLRAALDEIAASGLAAAINVDNANSNGGCYYPRFNRVSGQVGILSRHSWGQALDTNTDTNLQGETPQMNCDVVRIFRKHNFAWGANFISTDGMHFEWVGTRRDQFQYPSTYCPNAPLATTGVESPTGRGEGSTPVPVGTATLFADDGFGSGFADGA